MSRRLIDADALKKENERLLHCDFPYLSETTLEELIDEAPTIDAEPVKRGEWRQTYLDHEAFGERPSIFYCSACCACSNVKTNYCPNCGARMDRE